MSATDLKVFALQVQGPQLPQVLRSQTSKFIQQLPQGFTLGLSNQSPTIKKPQTSEPLQTAAPS